MTAKTGAKSIKTAGKAKTKEIKARDMPVANKAPKRNIEIPKAGRPQIAQIIYMLIIIAFLVFVTLKYHSII